MTDVNLFSCTEIYEGAKYNFKCPLKIYLYFPKYWKTILIATIYLFIYVCLFVYFETYFCCMGFESDRRKWKKGRYILGSLLLRPIHTGRRRQRLSFTLNGVTSSVAELNCGSVTSGRFTGVARGRSWKLFNFSSVNAGVSQSDRYANTLVQTLANPVHATQEK